MRRVVEANENDLFDGFMLGQKLCHFGHSEPRGQLNRKPVDSGAYGRKGEGPIEYSSASARQLR